MLYKKLKEWVIKMQSWMRRTIKRNPYLRIIENTIILQKYVRRYLSQLHEWRIMKGRWALAEKIMTAIILLQCRIRIFYAKKRVRLLQRVVHKRNNAVLAIQRNWYTSKGNYSTFFLLAAYRARYVYTCMYLHIYMHAHTYINIHI
jgi:hypothetical protein